MECSEGTGWREDISGSALGPCQHHARQILLSRPKKGCLLWEGVPGRSLGPRRELVFGGQRDGPRTCHDGDIINFEPPRRHNCPERRRSDTAPQDEGYFFFLSARKLIRNSPEGKVRQ